MSTLPCSEDLILNGAAIKHVSDFKYLGSMMASSENDIRKRRALAWAAFWKLQKIWKAQAVPRVLKLKIFQTTCLPVLLYGCETWVITKSLSQYLDSYLTNCLRIILGIKRLDRVPNSELYRLTQLRPVTQTIQEKQLRWIGHILRKALDEPINIYALYQPTHGHRRRGRQRLLYPEYIAGLINDEVTLSPPEIRKMAQDRIGWSKLVSDCSAADR